MAEPELQGLAQPKFTDAFRAHIQAVRLFTRDFAELNLLIRGEESTDRMIAWATCDFLSDFNGTPHFTSFSLEDLFSRNQQHLAVRGTVISLLQSVGLLHTRNHLPFSDGGLSVQINDKAPMIQSWLQLFQAVYEQQKRHVKVALNINGILQDQGPSGVHSDYFALSAIGIY
jgi:hypothetical protein